MKDLQYKLEYRFLKAFILIVRLTPKRLIEVFAKSIGYTLFVFGIRKRIVIKNLEIAFGKDKSPQALRRIAKESYINAATIMLEFLCMGNLPVDSIQDHINLEGKNVLEQALNEGRGVIVAGNHFGNWELVTAAVSTLVRPLTIFTGMQKNKLVDNEINTIRERFGTQTISKAKTAGFEMLKALKDGKPLGMAGDLNVPHDNLFVDFFGKKAVVGQGLATFTLKRKAPLLFIWCRRTGPFKYQGHIKRLQYQLSGDSEADLQAIAQMISDELEDKIRSYPSQYFWFNRRWKTRPQEEKGKRIY